MGPDAWALGGVLLVLAAGFAACQAAACLGGLRRKGGTGARRVG